MRNITTHKVQSTEGIEIVALDVPGNTGPAYGLIAFHDIANRARVPGIAAAEGELERLGYTVLPFQSGSIPEYGVNGVTIEALLAICADRLGYFQAGPFACDENGAALAHIHSAMDRLKSRTRERIARNVEGTAQA